MEWSFTVSTTTSQPSCKVVTTLQGCEHFAQIATILWQPLKVAARLLQPSYFCMGAEEYWIKVIQGESFVAEIKSLTTNKQVGMSVQIKQLGLFLE